MKKIFLFTLAILSLIFIGFFILVLNINPVLESVKPELTKAVSSAIHQSVELGELDVQIFPSPAIKIADIKLAKDRSKGASLKSIRLNTELIPLIQGKIKVDELSIDEPQISIIKKPNNKLIVAGIDLSAKKERPKPKTTKANKKEKVSPLQSSKSKLDLGIKSASIINGNISFQDLSEKPEKSFNIKDINLDLSNMDLRGKGEVSLRASVFSKTLNNFRFKGHVDIKDRELQKGKGEFYVNLDDIDLSKLQLLANSYGVKLKNIELNNIVSLDSGPISINNGALLVKDLRLTIDEQIVNIGVNTENLLKPKSINVTTSADNINLHKILSNTKPRLEGFENSFIKSLKISGKHNLVAQKTSVSLSLGTTQIKTIPFKSLNTEIEKTPKALRIKSAKLNAFKGEINAKGSLKTKKQAFAFEGNGKGVELKSLSSTFLPQASIYLTGSLDSLNFKINGTTSEIPKSLHGPAKVAIVNGAVHGIGLVGEALAKINQIPGLSGNSLSTSVPQEHKVALSRDKTEFDLLSVSISLNNGIINLLNFHLGHPLYIIEGRGTIDFKGNLNLTTELQLTKILTKKILIKEPKLTYLLDKNESLVFPVIVKKEGKFPLVLPNLRQLAKRAINNTAKETARRELEKVAPGLGGAAKVLDSLF